MFAKEIMTTTIITATPETSVKDIARLLLENNISALPVADAHGKVVGMVSEGDLLGRHDQERIARGDWWLAMLAEGEILSEGFLATMQPKDRKAQDIMSKPVITVTENTPIADIAHVLMEYHIKRVAVVRDNHIVGIVSRADLIRVFAALSDQSAAAHENHDKDNALSQIFTALDKHFNAYMHPASKTETVKAPKAPELLVAAKDFQKLVEHFEQEQVTSKVEVHHKMVEQHKKEMDELISHHIDDAHWHSMLSCARSAAEHGQKQYMLLRFPSDLCIDGGRAINVMENTWPDTLQGEAAELYIRWQRDLKPQGFHLAAQIVDFPGGFPGDVGLFLVWGHKEH